MPHSVDERGSLAVRFLHAAVYHRQFLETCGPVPLLRVQRRKHTFGLVASRFFDPVGVERDPTDLTVNPIRFHFTSGQGARSLQRILPGNGFEMVCESIPQGSVVRLEQSLFTGINAVRLFR